MRKKKPRERKVSVMELMLTGLARPELVFCTVATTAELLKVHEKYVFQLLKEGHLERIRLVDRKGREVAVAILEDSIREYRARVPDPQLELLPAVSPR